MYYINPQTGMMYTGDLQPGDRIATDAEVADLLRDRRTYAEKRLAEYPSIGDMIDAMCKAQRGDRAELDTLLTVRDEIKARYPKQ